MHTPTHVVVNLALLARGRFAKSSWTIFSGAVVPDAPAAVIHLYYRIIWHLPEELVQQSTGALIGKTAATALHSFPLILLLLLLAAWRRKNGGIVFALSLLIHALLDFPVHHSDGLRHFWPLSDYKLVSPISYWDVAHHASWVRPLELAIFLGASIALWRRHPSRRWRALLITASVIMAVMLLSGAVFWSAYWMAPVD